MSEVRVLDPQPILRNSKMFRIVKQNRKQAIVNGDNEVIYAVPHFIAFKGYDLSKLLNAMNKRGYRDIEDIMSFENGKLR